eukprot:Platyproteum_vivax@DN5095_c0_g1_i1.p1
MQNCTSANSSFVRFLHPLDAVFYAPLSSTFGAIGVRFERRCPRRARFERPKVFPNFKPGLEDMHLMRTQSGGFMMRDSWPPVLNYGFKPQDPIPPKGKNPRIPGTVKKISYEVQRNRIHLQASAPATTMGPHRKIRL